MDGKLAVELQLALERGEAKEAMCIEHENTSWIANTNTGQLKPAGKTLTTPFEIFKVIIVKVS